MPEHPGTVLLRSGDPELFHAELVALVTEREADWLRDSRDLMMAMAPMHDCARRLGLDPAAAFRSAADEGPQSLRELVAGFGARTDITPHAFGFTVEETPDGQRYRYRY